MSNRRPPRLAPTLYVGLQRYFLTICCAGRRPLLEDRFARELTVTQLRHVSEAASFAVVAYCLMPDHLHVVVEGQTDDCDLLAFVRVFKQRTGFAWKTQCGERLWQASFYDHVLRDREATRDVVRYVLENPVRAGFVASPDDYPHSGSFVYERRFLIEWAFGWNTE